MAETSGKKSGSTPPAGGVAWKPVYLVFVVVLAFMAAQLLFLRPQPVVPSIAYGVFLDQLEAGAVSEVDLPGVRAAGGDSAKSVRSCRRQGAAREPVTDFTTRLPAFQGETLIGTLREHKVRINVGKPEQESLCGGSSSGCCPGS